jgi:hypothetical protein
MEDLTSQEEDFVLEQAREQAYIKLYKNSKGYNWEVKAYQKTTSEQLAEIKEKITKINNELLDEFVE